MSSALGSSSLSDQVEGLHWSAEPRRFELGAAVQQPDALPTKPRCILGHAAPYLKNENAPNALQHSSIEILEAFARLNIILIVNRDFYKIKTDIEFFVHTD